MDRKKIISVVIKAILILTIYPFSIMLIWNYVVIEKFNLPLIDFWDAFFIKIMIGMLYPKINTKEEQ